MTDAPVKCARCGRPFVDDDYLVAHSYDHKQEDQERLDREWEEQQRLAGKITSEWRSSCQMPRA